MSTLDDVVVELKKLRRSLEISFGALLADTMEICRVCHEIHGRKPSWYEFKNGRDSSVSEQIEALSDLIDEYELDTDEDKTEGQEKERLLATMRKIIKEYDEENE